MQFIREKLSSVLSSGEAVNRRLVLSVALAVAAVVAILVSLNSPKPVVTARPASAAAVVLPSVYVHLVGEVAKPGVYDLPANSRVFDAIFAAGGFNAKADQASINLARPVSDGEQIIVLAKGQTANFPAGGQSKTVSLNLANQQELETLPGVGPTLAARIIDWRLANGGFKKIEDLRKVSGIGNKLFQQIKTKAVL